MSFHLAETIVIIATAAAGAWTLLTRLSRLLALWAGPAEAGLVPTVEVQDFGEVARFKTAYLKNTSLFGNPIAPAQQRGGLLVQSFRYVRLEAHPEQPDPYYRLQLGLLGAELLSALGMKSDPNPTLAPIVAAYLAYQSQRGVDVLYAFGHPLTSPRTEGSKAYQVFERAWLEWPAGGTDPSEVERRPLGLELYNLERAGSAGPQVEWTPLRQALVSLSAMAVLTSVALPVVTGRRSRASARGLRF